VHICRFFLRVYISQWVNGTASTFNKLGTVACNAELDLDSGSESESPNPTAAATKRKYAKCQTGGRGGLTGWEWALAEQRRGRPKAQEAPTNANKQGLQLLACSLGNEPRGFGGGAVAVLLRLSVLQRSSFVELCFLITLSCRQIYSSFSFAIRHLSYEML